MQSRDLARTILLCLTGGSADAISYVRYDTFVGAMTGNTVLIGLDLAAGRIDRAGFHLAIVAVFLAGVIATQTALKAKIPASAPLVLTAILLGGSELIGGEWSTALCAVALGMQCTAVREIGGVSLSTVFITGNLVRLGSAVPHAAEPEHQTALAVLATAWIAYAVGALIGALALHMIAHPMVVPAALALVAALVEPRAPGAKK